MCDRSALARLTSLGLIFLLLLVTVVPCFSVMAYASNDERWVYNGKVLPAIPSEYRDKYPQAIIVQELTGDESWIWSYRLILFDDGVYLAEEWGYVDETEALLLTKGSRCIYLQLLKDSPDKWEYSSFSRPEGVSQDMVFPLGSGNSSDSVLWAWRDFYDENGALVRAGSRPILYSDGPSDPDSPSIPDTVYPGPRGAQTPVWVKKLDVLSMPNFQVGSDPVTFEAQAYTNDGGTIFYKWRLSGQKWNDGGFIPGSETEYTPSSNGTKFQVPLAEEGLYSLTCFAYNVLDDEVSGLELYSWTTTCSITFTVTERESDPVPDTIKPPYEGWEDDMVNAQGLNKEIQDITDSIDNVTEITDSIVTPNIDNINLDLGSLIDPVGFAGFATILGLYWENNIVMLVITIAFVLAMIGFYLFGKR